MNIGIPLSWLARILGSDLSGSGGEMGGCISFGLGIDGSAFQVSSWGLDCGFSCGGFQGGVSRSVLMRIGLVGLQYFFLGHLIYPHFVRYCKYRHIVNDICVL